MQKYGGSIYVYSIGKGHIMKLVQSGNKWVLYDDNGKIIVITRVRKIAERMMK